MYIFLYVFETNINCITFHKGAVEGQKPTFCTRLGSLHTKDPQINLWWKSLRFYRFIYQKLSEIQTSQARSLSIAHLLDFGLCGFDRFKVQGSGIGNMSKLDIHSHVVSSSGIDQRHFLALVVIVLVVVIGRARLLGR